MYRRLMRIDFRIFIYCFFFSVMLASAAVASPLYDNIGARVRGGNTNWEAALFSDPITGASTYDTHDLGGGNVWPGGSFDFSFEYHGSTGIAQFLIDGVTSIFSDDIGLQDYGFQEVTLTAVGRSGGVMSVTNLVFNGNSQRDVIGDSSTPPSAWDTLEIYSGAALSDILITGTFTLSNDYYNMAERTKMNISLGGAQSVASSSPVPEPASILLLGAGLSGVWISARRKKVL